MSILRPTIVRVLALVAAAFLVSFAFKLGMDRYVAEQTAKPVYAEPLVNYSPRVEVYVDAGVYLFTDELRPGGYHTIERCRGRLLEMKAILEAHVLPEIAKRETIHRWRGVCVDAREADLGNQTSDV